MKPFSDLYFEEHPNKVLGVPVTRTGRFGEVLEVKGTVKDLDKIEVDFVASVIFDFEELAILNNSEKIVAQIIQPQKEAEPDKDFTHGKVDSDEVITDFRFGTELWQRYNSQISRAELEAFLYSHPEIKHSKFIDKFQYTTDQLVKEGLLCYHQGKLVYLYEYIVGNLAKKRSLLTRRDSKDANYIGDKWGDKRIDAQIEILKKYTPKAKRIGSTKDSITVLPHSTIAKTFTVESLMSGVVQIQDEKKTWIEVEKATLAKAFEYYLTKLTTAEDFKFSTAADIILYYLRNRSKPIPSHFEKEEKKKAEQESLILKKNAKEDGDRLFLKFLNNELSLEDKQKFEIIWNENYNSYRSFSDRLENGLETIVKIPVGFSQSRHFGVSKSGTPIPLLLSDTQRNGIALTLVRSVLLGYGVGLGKTLTDIFAIAQLVELGVCKRPLIVVPNNVYYKWRKEITGDSVGTEWFQGALPHFPNVRDLYNLNNDIIRGLKIFNEEEQDKLNQVKKAYELLVEETPAIKRSNALTAKIKNKEYNAYAETAIELATQIQSDLNAILHAPQYINAPESQKDQFFFHLDTDKKFQVNIKGILQRMSFADVFLKDFRSLLKQQENYLVATLGKLKPVPPGTISMLTYEGLGKIGLKEPDLIINRLYEILTQGDTLENDRDAASIFERMKSLTASTLEDSKIYIDDLGIDSVHVDEVHMAKNIFDSVKGSVRYEYEKDDDGNILYKDGQPLRTPIKTDSGETARDTSFYQLSSGMSMRALLMYMIIHYLQLKNKNRGVVGLSATPFSNSPLEIFSILSLINHQVLEESGFTGLKDFFDTFMKIEIDIVITADNRIEKDVVLKGFHNLSQLRQVILAVIDYKTNEAAGTNKPLELVYPSTENGLRSRMVMTDLQQALMDRVELFIEDKDEPAILNDIEDATSDKEVLSFLESLPYKKAKREYTELGPRMAGVAILKAMAKMKQIALSPLFYMLKEIGIAIEDVYPLSKKSTTDKILDPNLLVRTSPKFQYVMSCIKSTLDYERSHNLPLSGQIVYSTWGVELFPIFVDYLCDPANKFGLSREQIGIITGKTSTAQKERIKDDFLSGKILVLFGSKSIQVGVDLQKNTSSLYMLDYDWNPTDDEQVRGRHCRQGNRHNWVRTVYPMLEDSIDPIIFQYLLEKSARLKEIWNLDVDLDNVDLSGIDFEMLKDELITNPVKRAQIEIIREKDKFTDQTVFIQNQLSQLGSAPYILKALSSNFDRFHAIGTEFLEYYRIAEINSIKKEASERLESNKEFLADRLSDLKEMQLALKNARIAKSEKGIESAEAKIAELETKIENYRNTIVSIPEKRDAKLKETRDYIENVEGLLFTFQSADSITSKDASSDKLTKLLHFAQKLERTFKAPPERMSDFSIFSKREKYAANIASFRTSFEDFVKIKERILDRLGYGANDVNEVISNLKKDLASIHKLIEKIERSFDVRYDRIVKERMLNSQSFKTAEDRVEEFAKTNFLLHENAPKRVNIIAEGYEPQIIPKDKNREKEKARARMRMRMRILELELQLAS